MLSRFNSLFPVWAILFSCLAFYRPELFTPHKGLINPLLMAVMFFMGLTLSSQDFVRVFKKPVVIMLTVFLQFSLMPLFALMISKLLNFNTDLLVGMILVGAVSGGTASNVMTYLAKGDVALSISMTMMSTLLSVIVTPLLISLYLGSSVSVDVSAIIKGLVQIVFAPIAFGIMANYLLRKQIARLETGLATLSMLTIVVIIAIVVSLNQANIQQVGALVILGVVVHNGLGLLSGYGITKLFGYNEKICRTVAIEVGMQNSGLAASLGTTYFSQLSALPGAIFSIWHNVSGAILAGYWSKRG